VATLRPRQLSLVSLAVAALVAVSSLLAVGVAALQADPAGPPRPAHHLLRGFRNLDGNYRYTVLERTQRMFRKTLEGWPQRGQTPRVLPNDGAALRANGTTPTLTWIGHATLLVQIGGMNVLTDPIWSDRASPVSFAGPRRLVPPGMRFEDLPRIDAVVISHDHYDHLDVETVERLVRDHQPRFFVPLGMKEWLVDHGARDVVELDWWQAAQFRGLTFTCAPAQHSSGRGLRDQNLRLWSSWVIAGGGKKLWFAGDTGYTKSLREIGKRLGPFDVAAIPVGGYSAYEGNHPNHVNPEEAVQLFEEQNARLMVPIHFGTFDLNREPFAEPPTRLLKAAVSRGLEEYVAILSAGQSIHW
jgi:N-acyl-phosphatidylethanolamine-hydrolysing phospholipase D